MTVAFVRANGIDTVLSLDDGFDALVDWTDPVDVDHEHHA